MELLHTFCRESWPFVEAGRVRLTRLNIYSGLYVEFHKIQILIDPSKILPRVVSLLDPDLILVSHESMDHFDAPICLKLLQKEQTYLVGSWGVIVALTDYLPFNDSRWDRIYVGIPGASFRLGGLSIKIEQSIHCEYAVPIFFDIQDATTGFRILDAVDTEITPQMREHDIPPNPNIMVVPLGIALAANPSQAWDMVQLLQPSVVFANHFTIEQNEFRTLARGHYQSEQLLSLSWYESVTLEGADPNSGTELVISFQDATIDPNLAGVLANWIKRPPDERTLVSELEQATAPESISIILYFLAWNALLGHASSQVMEVLKKVREYCLLACREYLAASFLLAFGSAIGSIVNDATLEVTSLKKLLTPNNPYLAYWVLESWGRAAKNEAMKAAVINLLEGVAADTELFACVGVRRKMMWEIYRLVELGYLWTGLQPFLVNGCTDPNPDVRLLVYKILPRCHTVFDDISKILAAGLCDKHEDVLEWAIIAHIQLFDLLTPMQRKRAFVELPKLLNHTNYHVREQANALAELSRGN